jgi:outer membrane lipoprotein-sorting protein
MDENRARGLWILIFAFAFAFAARGAEANGLLDQWFAAQTNLHTWSADLTQTRSLKVLAQPLISTGKVWVAPPDHFRWELGQPAQTIALRLPDQLLLIYPRLKRVEKYALNNAPPGPWKDALALLEASFPRSQGELESCFRLLSVVPTNSIVEVALEPKSASARKFMTEIHVGFRTNDFTLTATEMKFTDGSSLRTDFTNSAVNPPLPPETFEVKLPPDYTVVEPLRK